MDDHDWLARRFEDHRAHLRAVAYRMLGSSGEADDAVQEAWLRLSRSDTSGIDNLGGWLTTVVARVCLNMLQARRSRREQPVGHDLPEPPAGRGGPDDPEQQALEADSVGLALLVVLDPLTPAERLAFVLHDLFAVPFEEIAPILERSPAAARQLASRARRRVRGAEPPEADVARQRAVVDAFLAASREGDFDALVALLDPDVVLRADRAVVRTGAVEEVPGGGGGGRDLLGAGPGGAAGAGRRGRRGRVGAGRPAAGGVRLHRRRRPDHRHRAAGRPRPPGPARTGVTPNVG